MDVSRLKKVLAGISASAVMLTQMGTVLAAYSDVPSGVWYGEAVEAFVDAGYLDSSQTRFRGGDLANRAEFVKLVVELNGGILSTPPAVPSFNDVAASAWYYGYMEEAAKEGWVKGDKNCYGSKPCYARPAANINRAEAAAVLVRAFALEPTGDAPQFVDNASGQWYTDAIQTAADHCVLQGDDSTGRVRPADNMNRAEMVTMLFRVDQNLSFGVDCGTDNVSMPGLDSVVATAARTVEVEFATMVDQDAAEMAANYKVTSGSKTIAVSSVKMVGDRAVELTLEENTDPSTTYTLTVSDLMTDEGEEFSDSASFKGYSPIQKGEGELEVSVSSKNPMGDSVPKGAIGVPMLSLDLTASCDDSVIIEDMTVLHEGFGNTSDITGLYVSVDGTRMSRKRTIDSKDQAATLHFSTPLTVAACKTVTMDIMADMSTTATTSAEHNVVVELPSDVISNALAVSGNFPLKGNTFRVAAITSGQLTVSYRSVTPSERNVGEKGVPLGRFEVSADSVEDQTIYAMTIQQNGTAADGDVTNLKIRRSDGTVLTNTVAAFTGDYATFVFNPPLIVKEGDRFTVEVVGDIAGGAGDTVALQFEESSDIFAVGSLYGYGVNGQLYGSQISVPSNNNTNTVTIGAGEFTIEINGPSQKTYTTDDDDANLANVNITTDGDRVDVRKLFFAIQALSSTGSGLGSATNVSNLIENVEVYNKTSGRSVDAVRLTTQGTATAGDFYSDNNETWQIYRVDDFTVDVKSEFEVRVDFKDNGSGNHPLNGDQFKVHICGEAQQDSAGANTDGCTFGGLISSSTAYQMQIEGLSTGDDVTDFRPGGTITGTAQRIATEGLTVAVKSIGTTETAVKNSKNVNLLRFEARSGEAKDILLTSMIFTSASGSITNGQNYSLWVDTDSNGVVDTKAEGGVAAQSSKVTFGDLAGGGFVIPKEKTVVFEVHADIAASLTNNWLMLRFSTGDSDFIEAEDVVRGSALSGIKVDTANCASTTCEIIYTHATSKAYSLVNQGDLFVTKDTVSLRSRQCLGGELCDPVLRIQFHAEYEPIDVTDLQISSSGSTADSVDRLELYKEGATTPFATATTSGCGSDDTYSVQYTSTSTFCSKMQSQQLVVAKGQDVKVIVRPRLKTDESGATPNQVLQFFLDRTAVSNNATGSGSVRARGQASSNNLAANDGDSASDGEVIIGASTYTANALFRGEKNLSVLSKVASITNANPDANGTAVPTGVSDVGQFKIAAASHNNSKNGLNKITLSGVIFNVSATNVTMDPTAFVFYNKTNSSVTNACTATNTSGTAIANNASGSFLVRCSTLPSGSVNVTIDQGADATFVLRGTVLNPKVANTNSTLQVALQNFDNINNSTFSATTSHFQWRDADNAAATTATFNWIEYPETTVKSTNYQS